MATVAGARGIAVRIAAHLRGADNCVKPGLPGFRAHRDFEAQILRGHSGG